MEARVSGRKRTLNREVLILNYEPAAESDADSLKDSDYTPDQGALFESSSEYKALP